MATNKILEALAELEQTLKQIESAKEQVEKTVGAYSDVGDRFNVYSQELANVSKHVNEVIEFIKHNREILTADINGIFDEKFQRLDQIITDFNQSVGYTRDNFKKDSDTLIHEVEQNNIKIKNKFDDSIDVTAAGFNERVERNMAELSKLVNEMNNTLLEFRSLNDQFDNKLKCALEPIQNDLAKAMKSRQIFSYTTIVLIIILGVVICITR